MKSNGRYIYWFIIAVLLVLLFQKSCCKEGTLGPGLVTIWKETKIDTIPGKSIDRPVPMPYAVRYIDSIKVHDTTPGKPYPIYISDTGRRSSIVTTQTIEEIQKALKEAKIPLLYYPDTLWLGDKGYVAIKDTIQGLLTSRAFDWKLFIPTTTITKVLEQKKKNKVFAGLEYMYPVNYLGAGIMLQFKNDNILKGGYGYAYKKRQYSFSYFFKIKLNK